MLINVNLVIRKLIPLVTQKYFEIHGHLPCSFTVKLVQHHLKKYNENQIGTNVRRSNGLQLNLPPNESLSSLVNLESLTGT